MTSAKYITAKEIAQKYALSYQSINRYSDAGLLPVAFKKGNIRYFERSVVIKRMKTILEMSKDGYSLLLIRKKILGI
ncbi:MAG: MerR family transcriptional regulator [Candidatus Omnitrophica bacterium]|nr:MerR family transcriptional regulator [Candidatus Omnitrophota bacterium]